MNSGVNIHTVHHEKLSINFDIADFYARRWFRSKCPNGQLHEAEATKYLLKNLRTDSVVLDVGAHLGYYTIWAAQRAKRVFALEPIASMAWRIDAHCMLNGFENVHIIPAVAGNRNGMAPYPKFGGPGTRLDMNSADNMVPMLRLDDFFIDQNSRPTIVKIDVEGAELRVLQGAINLLKTRPKLILECHDKMQDFDGTIEEVLALIQECGYQSAWIWDGESVPSKQDLKSMPGLTNCNITLMC